MTSVTSVLVSNVATPSGGELPTPALADPVSDAAFRAALTAIKVTKASENNEEPEISDAEISDDGDVVADDQANEETKPAAQVSDASEAPEFENILPEPKQPSPDSQEDPSPEATMLATALKIADDGGADPAVALIAPITSANGAERLGAETLAKPLAAKVPSVTPPSQQQAAPSVAADVSVARTAPDASAAPQHVTIARVITPIQETATPLLRLDITNGADRTVVTPTQQIGTAFPAPTTPPMAVAASPKSVAASPPGTAQPPQLLSSSDIADFANLPVTETAKAPLTEPATMPGSAPSRSMIPVSGAQLSAPSELSLPIGAAPLSTDMPLFADDAPDGLGTTNTSTLATGASRAAIAMPHHVPPAIVMQQIAEAARTLPNAPVEITLSPEELGRVRMTLTVSEVGMSVQVTVERDETLALLRRHSEMLSGALGDLNLGALDIGFHQEGDGTPNEQTGGGQGASLLEPLASITDEPPGPTLLLQDRLDIRL